MKTTWFANKLNYSNDYKNLIKLLADMALEKTEAEFPTSEIKKNHSTTSRYIPANIKREVWQNAQGRCSYVSATGQRCSSQYALEYDHINPLAHGEKTEAQNIRLLCKNHSTPEQAWNTGVKIPRLELFIRGSSRRLVL